MKEILERRLDRLSETGNGYDRPNTAPLGDGLFEVRGRSGKVQARLIFFFDPNIRKRITFVYACYKDKKAQWKRDIKIADRNRKTVLGKTGGVREFNIAN